MSVARIWITAVWMALAGIPLLGSEDSLETAGVLQIPVDRQAAEDLESAARHLDRGEQARAAALLGTVWFEAQGQLAGNEELVTSLADRIAALSKRLPETDRSEFWLRMEAASGPAAETMLRGIPTPAGLSAIEHLAERLKDAGNFELAAAAFARAANHPSAASANRVRNQIQRLDCLTEVTGPNAAREWLASTTPEIRQQTMVIAGESTTVEAWLTRPRAVASLPLKAAPLDRPVLSPSWEWAAPMPGNLSRGLARAGEELRSHGLAQLPSIRPMVIGSRIITRTLLGLTCLDAGSGALLWDLPNPQAAHRATLAGQQNNPLFSGKLFSALNQQLQTNTLLGAMTHDVSTIYHVVESHGVEPSKTSSGYVLEAVDVVSGQRLWRTRGTTKSKDDTIRELDWRPLHHGTTAATEGISVCGPPVVLGNRLFLLAEQSSELIFLAVNQGTLQVEWSVSLGQLLPDASRAAPRTYMAAALLWTGDSIVCVTNCGAVAAIDPLREQVRWIARYPIELWSVGRLDPTNLDPSPAAALRTWRESSVWLAEDKLICVSPESPAIHVLQANTGRSLLSIPREAGLKILTVTAQQIVVLEPLAIRAHDLPSGQLLWRTSLGEIRGAGIVTERQIVQPMADGSVAVLNLDDGRRLPGAVGAGAVSGNLVSLIDGWLSADDLQLRKFTDAGLTSQHAAAGPVQRAELHYVQGDFPAARQELANSTQPAVHTLARSLGLAELQFHPERFASLRDDLLARSSSAEQQAMVHFLLAESAVDQRQWFEAMQFALDGLNLDQAAMWTQRGEPLRRVRADRALQGLLSIAWERGDRAQMTAALAAKWQQARDQSDPFALQQLEQRWRTLAFSRDRLVEDAESVFLGASQMTRELSLLSAMQSLQDETGLRVAAKLREEQQMSGFARDAAAIEQRMLRDSPGQIVAGQTVRQSLQEQGVSHRPESSFAVWPDVAPRITSTKESSDEAYQTVIPIEAEPGSVWERLDVTIDRQGQTLRFTGDDQSGAWTLPIARGTSQLQHYPFTYQGWGWGRLLLVRVGTQLMAVAPWNEQGEPQVRLLWSLDLLGQGAQLPEQLVIERVTSVSKRANEAFRMIDQYGREICLVGPVRPSYLCYLQQGKLIAVETQTGQRLWERWDLAPGAMLWGDDEFVMVFDPNARQVEKLSARDGQPLAVLSCVANRSEIWHVVRGKIWTGHPDDGMKLVCHDFVANKPLWKRTFPHDCLPIALDEFTGAVLDPRGVVHLIDLETGNTLDEPLTVELPRPMERLLLSRDESRWYLGISGPADRSFEWTTTQPLNSYRRPLLHGPLVAIDRQTHQILWTREIAGEPWLLDQNKSTPVLAQIFKTPPPMNGQGIGEGVLRLLDKKTGRVVFDHRDLNLLPYFSLQPQPDFQTFEVRTHNTLFQVDYGPEDADIE